MSTDEGAKHSYTFTGTTVPAAGSVTIASGTATDDITWVRSSVRRGDDHEPDSRQI
ncbi:hypothetical protein [Methanosphaerula subterraneus]|uniref:hypothetical protein n=1 Tax=Methanosphaerula subterraneus TaxID=3350244 RepID=UPI003F8359D3